MADEVENAHSDWNTLKSEIERNFQQWLEELTEIPQTSPRRKRLTYTRSIRNYAFSETNSALVEEETREVLTRFGESLSDFQNIIAGLQNRLYQMDKERRNPERLLPNPFSLRLPMYSNG